MPTLTTSENAAATLTKARTEPQHWRGLRVALDRGVWAVGACRFAKMRDAHSCMIEIADRREP